MLCIILGSVPWALHKNKPLVVEVTVSPGLSALELENSKSDNCIHEGQQKCIKWRTNTKLYRVSLIILNRPAWNVRLKLQIGGCNKGRLGLYFTWCQGTRTIGILVPLWIFSGCIELVTLDNYWINRKTRSKFHEISDRIVKRTGTLTFHHQDDVLGCGAETLTNGTGNLKTWSSCRMGCLIQK